MALISVSACSDPPGPTGGGGRAGVGGSSSGGVVTNGGAVSGGTTSQGGTLSAGGTTSLGGSTTTGGSAAGGASGGTTSAAGGAATGGATTGGSAGAATGGGGGAAPQGGSGGAAVELKQPIRRDEKYVLEFGDTILEVEPSKGGRVTKFAYKGTNIVAGTDQTKNETNWGSVFWPSPQKAWVTTGDAWPPPEHFDKSAYTAALDGNTIVLTSSTPAASSAVQLTLEKRISADLAKQAIVMDFKMTNVGMTEKSWAAWQVTRVAAGGITFFPTGGADVSNTLTITKQGDVSWFNQATGVPSSIPMDQGGKLITDAKEPWLAHAAGSLVLIKTFPAVEPSAFAPAEGEIEIYSTRQYVEIEPQGPYVTTRPTGNISWSVRWYLREVPAPAKVAVGDAELVKFVRSIAQ